MKFAPASRANRSRSSTEEAWATCSSMSDNEAFEAATRLTDR
jgi:hypothetical protein